MTNRYEHVDEMNCLNFEGTSTIKSNAIYYYTDNDKPRGLVVRVSDY